MRIPVRLSPRHPARKLLAALVIAVVATVLAIAAHRAPAASLAMAGLDNVLYDAFYHLRRPAQRDRQPIVIVAVDEGTMEQLGKKKIHWPFPRVLWASTVQYLEKCGAKAVVFDIIFPEPAAFDVEFGKALDETHIPVVLGSIIDDSGKPGPFAPRVKKPPVFGAVNILNERVIHDYKPSVAGVPSLALRAATAAGVGTPAWASQPFRLHYYGPTGDWRGTDGKPHQTYKYVAASSVFAAAANPARAHELGADASLFRGKIVVIGTTAAGTYDLKSSPLSPLYPGVEAQATAIDNLLSNQAVQPFGAIASALIALDASLLAALGVILPRRVTLKVLAAIVVTAALFGGAVAAFLAYNIHWLPMAAPLLALLIATVAAFAFSYFTEDRQRRLVLKALSQYVSPEVASEIERNPDSLKLGGQRREMTVMFTDIQGFTDLSETMESERLSELLNFYLGEMSEQILACNGTLDKYIGDAIMSFWNAPMIQADHAALACRAALAMRDREAAIQPDLRRLGAPNLLTRIGINTGPMVFGNMGAPQKFNYSVLGDSVNLGSRLEGANKFYGSRILIAETTAELVKDQFILRQLDVLRVKGKQKPLAVYELLAQPENADRSLRERVEQYEKAFGFYRAQRWDDADDILKALHERHPEDGPAASLLKRIARLRTDPPPADWDGVYVAKDK